MRKTFVLSGLLMAISIGAIAQSQANRKPSPIVRTPSQAESTTADSQDSEFATSDSTAVQNGPIYADEKGPLPPPTTTLHTANRKPAAAPDLPTGTAIWMKLETSLSSKRSQEGDGFSGRVTRTVVANGRTVIPIGASITGRVLRVREPRRFAGTGSLRLMPETVILPNGKSFYINASMVDTSTPKKLTVDDEGRIKARGVSSGDKVEMVAGTGVGAIAGTILGGGQGMLIGSVVGGGATVVHWLTKRHPVEIPAGTELIMEINRPVALGAEQLNAGN